MGKVSFLKFFCISLLFFSSLALAKGKSTEEDDSIPADLVENEIYDDSPFVEPSVESHFSVRGKQFEASLEGFGTYLSNLKKADPKSYNKVQGDYQELIKQRDKAVTWSLYMGGAGALTMIAGLTFLQSEETDANNQTERKPNLALVGGGFLLGFVGSMVYLYMNPQEPEYLDFIRKHNKALDSKNHIQWDLGYNPKTKSPSLIFAMDF